LSPICHHTTHGSHQSVRAPTTAFKRSRPDGHGRPVPQPRKTTPRIRSSREACTPPFLRSERRAPMPVQSCPATEQPPSLNSMRSGIHSASVPISAVNRTRRLHPRVTSFRRTLFQVAVAAARARAGEKGAARMVEARTVTAPDPAGAPTTPPARAPRHSRHTPTLRVEHLRLSTGTRAGNRRDASLYSALLRGLYQCGVLSMKMVSQLCTVRGAC